MATLPLSVAMRPGFNAGVPPAPAPLPLSIAMGDNFSAGIPPAPAQNQGGGALTGVGALTAMLSQLQNQASVHPSMAGPSSYDESVEWWKNAGRTSQPATEQAMPAQDDILQQARNRQTIFEKNSHQPGHYTPQVDPVRNYLQVAADAREGMDPERRAKLDSMHAAAQQARSMNERPGPAGQASLLNRNTGMMEEQTANNWVAPNSDMTVSTLAPLTDKQQENRVARSNRYDRFLDQREQDAQLEGLPPLTRFIAKQMGGEGGMNPLLLATASPGLGQMAMTMQQSNAENQLRQQQLGLNAYETAMQYDPQREMARTMLPILAQSGLSPGYLMQAMQALAPGGAGMAGLTSMLGDTQMMASMAPSTETPQQAINQVASRFDLNTAEGLQQARDFLEAKGVSRQQIMEVMSDNAPGYGGMLWRTIRNAADWTGGEQTQAEIEGQELQRTADIARRLLAD